MSLEYKFESLEGSFPRELTKSWERDSSPFGKTWTQVQDLLERELRQLGYRVGSVVLQTAHSPSDVRKDGRLRSDVRKPEHPGVVLKFDVYDSAQSRYVQMSFECDRFTEWKANVRAIADAMEALRKINRYGVSGGGRSNAHYEGYKALPSADDRTNKADAAVFLSSNSSFSSGEIFSSKQCAISAYRQALHKLHPDKGGNTEDFHKLQKAKEALEI